jgi:hypothetical protein
MQLFKFNMRSSNQYYRKRGLKLFLAVLVLWFILDFVLIGSFNGESSVPPRKQNVKKELTSSEIRKVDELIQNKVKEQINRDIEEEKKNIFKINHQKELEILEENIKKDLRKEIEKEVEEELKINEKKDIERQERIKRRRQQLEKMQKMRPTIEVNQEQHGLINEEEEGDPNEEETKEEQNKEESEEDKEREDIDEENEEKEDIDEENEEKSGEEKREEKSEFSDEFLISYEPLNSLIKNDMNLPGENGRSVRLNPKQKSLSEKTFHENEFNVVVSDLIALDRSIPDTRPEQ